MTSHTHFPENDASPALTNRKQRRKMRSQNRLSRGLNRLRTPFFACITFSFYVL